MKYMPTTHATVAGAECVVQIRADEVVQTFHARIDPRAIERRLAFQEHVGMPYRTRSCNGRRLVYPNYGRDCLEETNDLLQHSTCGDLIDFISRLAPLLCVEVERLHRLNVAHCDIKLENVLWNGERPHLIDFGAAVWIDTEGPAVVARDMPDPRLAFNCVCGTVLPDMICKQAMLPLGSSTLCPWAEDARDYDKYAFGIMLRIVCTSVADASFKATSQMFAWLWSVALDLTNTRKTMLAAWQRVQQTSAA